MYTFIYSFYFNNGNRNRMVFNFRCHLHSEFVFKNTVYIIFIVCYNRNS